jgi:hypothetical protein
MHLATGTAACFDELGWPLYTVADAARLLGVAHREIDSVSAASASSLVPRIVCETRRRVPSTGVNSASIRHTSARSSRNPLDGDRRSASSSLSHGVEQYAVFVDRLTFRISAKHDKAPVSRYRASDQGFLKRTTGFEPATLTLATKWPTGPQCVVLLATMPAIGLLSQLSERVSGDGYLAMTTPSRPVCSALHWGQDCWTEIYAADALPVLLDEHRSHVHGALPGDGE